MRSVEEYKKIFGVADDQDLAAILRRAPQSVSNWKRTGIPAAIERRANELMIERGLVPIISEKAEPYSAEDQEIIEITKNHPLIKLALTEMVRLSEEKQFKYWQEMRDEGRRMKELSGTEAAQDEDQ